MSFQFYNNWPYSYSIFPTMEDHLDPVNNEYFTGLHKEIQNLEVFLGEMPQEPHDTVKQKLELHDHTGDHAGIQLDHLDLANIGVNTHAEIDEFFAAWSAQQGQNLLDNSNFETWQRGNDKRPDRWYLVQTLNNWPVAKESTIVKSGLYSMKLTKDVAGDGILDLTRQWVENPKLYNGKAISASIWVYIDTDYDAVTIRLYIDDDSGGHLLNGTGTKGQWIQIKGTYTVTSASKLGIVLEAEFLTGGGTYLRIYFDMATLLIGNTPADIIVHPAEDTQRYQRYCQSIVHAHGHAEASGNAVAIYAHLPAPMKSVPTIAAVGTIIFFSEIVGETTFTLVSHTVISESFVRIFGNVSPGIGGKEPGYLSSGSFLAEATEPTG